MGLKGGIGYVRLLDEAGGEVRDPFLPLDAEFWNRDRTRFTVFFDPGRAEARHSAQTRRWAARSSTAAPIRWSFARVA